MVYDFELFVRVMVWYVLKDKYEKRPKRYLAQGMHNSVPPTNVNVHRQIVRYTWHFNAICQRAHSLNYKRKWCASVYNDVLHIAPNGCPPLGTCWSFVVLYTIAKQDRKAAEIRNGDSQVRIRVTANPNVVRRSMQIVHWHVHYVLLHLQMCRYPSLPLTLFSFIYIINM